MEDSIEQYKTRLRELAEEGVSEEGHIEADDILCKILIENGYEDVVNLYECIDKWYA